MTFLSLQGPVGVAGPTTTRTPVVHLLPAASTALVDDARRIIAAGGAIGDLALAPSGELYSLESSNGLLTLVEVASLAGPKGPDGPEGGGPVHTATQHGKPTPGWKFTPGTYAELAAGPTTESLKVVAYP